METAGIRASSWVVGKALSPLSDSLLETWAASTKLGSNIDALKMELLNARGREIHNHALAQMLDRMRQLAYGADDALDELDYFRIQDELNGTYHAADAHAAGCVQDLALNARHTARACVNKLKFPMCTGAARRREQDDGDNVGKHFSCFSLLPSTSHIAQTNIVGNPNTTGQNRHLKTPKLKFDRLKMSRKILDIAEQLKPICAKVAGILSLELHYSSHTATEDIAMNRPKTTPQIIEPKLYGRDVHKKIVADEFANGEGCELTVLPIVGPWGIGKTTFTQHVYEEMKSHFEVPIWICVSLDFNVNRLAKEIVKKIPTVNIEKGNCSDEELIEQRLKGKRVLLVLDDVWKHPEDEWKKLIALFKKQGVKGNMVIVTTRIPEVANMVKTTKCSLELESLRPKDITSFFEECVFGDQTPWVDHVELSDVGSKIIKKLKGSPLAARTVGRLLRNTLTLNHWRSVLESKEWESQTDKNGIMPALKLSYEYLPFHLQQCFSFCSLFPEDYEFGCEELVHFWIGLDILHSCDDDNRIIEHVGLCYLNDLVNYGFFKMNEKEDGRPYYTIHDLLHELAVKVSSYQCLSIYSSNARDVHIPPYVRHLSIIVDDKDVENKMSFEEYNENLRSLDKRLKVENLHTLMLYGDHHGSFAKTFGHLFKEATSFRTISLSGVSYNVENILHNFSKLVHLRYLRIKGFCYGDLRLPSTLFRLYHLEVIDLQNLRGDICSTRNMNNLIKLRHFLVRKDKFNLHSDILGVGKLKLLRELKEFRVGKESEGFELSQLGRLTDIGGSLGIYNLEKVQSKEEADELKLTQKNHIRELILEWDVEQSSKDHVKEDNVLDRLVPHSDLQGLHIRGHGGSSCPSWLGTNLTVKNLESLCLHGVSWKNLPCLGEMWMVNEHGEEYQGCSISTTSFHNLKRLQLINIPFLKKWVGSGACPLFSHLEVFIIRDCPELIELPFSHPTCCECEAQREEKMAWFPRLWELVIVDCPKLASVPCIPWRTGAPCSAEIVSVGSGFENLGYTKKERSELTLDNSGKDVPGDVLWNGLNFCNLTDLQELRMYNIPPLPLDHLQLLTSLKTIRIYFSSSILPPVQSAAHGVYRFPCEDLTINKCDSSGEELALLLSFLPNLSKLHISECDNLTELGVAETVSGEQRQQQTRGEEEIITAAQGLLLLPPHLEELEISFCKNISLLSNPPHDDHANPAGEGRGGGLQRLHSLRSLDVQDCPEFLSSYSPSSSSFLPFPTSLQHLTLWDVKHMDRLHAFSNLTSLTKLDLRNRGHSTDVAGPELEVSRGEALWPVITQGSLTDLSVDGLPHFFASSYPSRPDDKEEFSRSSKLLKLETSDNTGFLAAPICSLFSSTLTRLTIEFSNELERLTKEQEEALSLLTSLQELLFYPASSFPDKLICLPAGLQKLINLKKLSIYWCSAIQSLPSLPSSLQMLDIFECGAIESLPNSLPSSLEILTIRSCKAIKSLPKGGLPSSMRELDVYYRNGEELKRACRKLIGTIPIIRT